MNLLYKSTNKYGDLLSLYIATNICFTNKTSNKYQFYNDYIKLIPYNTENNFTNIPHFLMTGLSLNNILSNSIILGLGMNSPEKLNICDTNKIISVRGELTQKLLKKNNISIESDIIGDPSLILPLLYNNSITKKYKIGIIVHTKYYTYLEKMLLSLKINNIKIINFELQHDNIKKLFASPKNDRNSTTIINKLYESVLNNILQCDIIMSSLLHGIIVANAYNIPAIYIKTSDNDFKFYDYFYSVGINMKCNDAICLSEFDYDIKYVNINDKNFFIKLIADMNMHKFNKGQLQNYLIIPDINKIKSIQYSLYSLYYNFINADNNLYICIKNRNEFDYKYINTINFDKSLLRFGDGELINIILLKQNIKLYQKYSEKLRNDLIETIKYTDNNLQKAYYFIDKRCIDMYLKLTNKNKIIIDASLFRINSFIYFNDFYNYLLSKNVIWVISKRNETYITKNICNIVIDIPLENLYTDDHRYIDEVVRKVCDINKKKKSIVLISGGPGGKILGLKLFKIGIHVIDIGNVMMFMKKIKNSIIWNNNIS